LVTKPTNAHKCVKVFYIVNLILLRPASSFETCQHLKFSKNRLRALSRVIPVVGLLTFSLGTGIFWDGISPIPDETVNTAVTRSSLPHLWEQGIPREGEDDCWVGEAAVFMYLIPTTCKQNAS